MTESRSSANDVLKTLPGIPGDDGGPVFRAPWEAQVFAIALALHERGMFGWKEWSAILADEISRADRAGAPDTGEAYYGHWLAALERLVAARGIGSHQTLTQYREAWRHAAERTPHGVPIELAADDFAEDSDHGLLTADDHQPLRHHVAAEQERSEGDDQHRGADLDPADRQGA